MLRLARTIALPFLMTVAVASLWHFIFHRAITVAIATLDAASKVTP